MDTVEFESTDEGTTVTMTKNKTINLGELTNVRFSSNS